MPTVDIVIPDEVGEDVEECVVVTWLKKAGDSIRQGEDLLILQAEKVSFEVPAPVAGTVQALLAAQGEVVKRDQPLARLEVSDEAIAESAPVTASEPESESPPSRPAAEVRASPIAKRSWACTEAAIASRAARRVSMASSSADASTRRNASC